MKTNKPKTNKLDLKKRDKYWIKKIKDLETPLEMHIHSREQYKQAWMDEGYNRAIDKIVELIGGEV